MDDATRQRMITLLAAAIAYVILEAVLKGATTATSTILASLLVRRLFRN